ncbi:hypothetical protein LshimejAT787_0106060 [Lyophyllum shimeji]|uniref:Uncharacterized protein n=1 Tax=Lyophyllum shimeji TaxID=47721 RepID=A0A9P3PDZ6_LYOSH|nr:hypothetical protein LshimejAT787_0106060 [Lyophyllum shimeji]
MPRLNDMPRPLSQSGKASSRRRQESVQLGSGHSDHDERHAQANDIRRGRERFPETSDTEDEMVNIRDSPMTDTEPVESSRSWSSTIPSVHRESAELEDSWADPSELSSQSDAGRRRHHDRRHDSSQPERQHAKSPASFRRDRQATPAYGHTGRRDDGREQRSRSRRHRTHDFAQTDRSYQPSEEEPDSEVIEPFIYEHEVWNVDRGAPELYYYIVPGGLNVIFRDENGNESMRVGEFGDSIYKPRRVSPTIIQDEFGNELYRTGDFGSTATRASSPKSDENDVEEFQFHSRRHRRRQDRSYRREKSTSTSSKAYSVITYASVPSNAANIILIDDKGQQIPIRTSTGKSSSSIARSHVPGEFVD